MSGMTKLGKYEIRRELGKGAMGVVYEGFDPIIERTVAIKTIRPEQLEKMQAVEILARFKREAQAAGRLNHPHIVAIYDYGEVVAEGGQAAAEGESARIAFIAMEFIKGRELKDYFDGNERFPVKETERIMSELLDALDHAHKNGVTHRDMKPANVILLGDGKVKVADFGIARIESSELTQAGTILGTPSYMSPEQFLGQPVDARSDLFSCGVILYQFLTGEKPFTGTVTTIMHKVLKEEPLPPSMLNVTLPPAWDVVVKKAMAKSPSEALPDRGRIFGGDQGGGEPPKRGSDGRQSRCNARRHGRCDAGQPGPSANCDKAACFGIGCAGRRGSGPATGQSGKIHGQHGDNRRGSSDAIGCAGERLLYFRQGPERNAGGADSGRCRDRHTAADADARCRGPTRRG
jgi:serine/threonine protein kinase